MVSHPGQGIPRAMCGGAITMAGHSTTSSSGCCVDN
jgi:hypothetical protein